MPSWVSWWLNCTPSLLRTNHPFANYSVYAADPLFSASISVIRLAGSTAVLVSKWCFVLIPKHKSTVLSVQIRQREAIVFPLDKMVKIKKETKHKPKVLKSVVRINLIFIKYWREEKEIPKGFSCAPQGIQDTVIVCLLVGGRALKMKGFCTNHGFRHPTGIVSLWSP